MNGNVEEWVKDWYDAEYYRVSPRNNPQGSEAGISKTLRGGAYYEKFYKKDANFRQAMKPNKGYPATGFLLCHPIQ